MAKGLYLGDPSTGVARRVKKLYIGDPLTGVARKVKRVYIGDPNTGLARLCWSGGAPFTVKIYSDNIGSTWATHIYISEDFVNFIGIISLSGEIVLTDNLTHSYGYSDFAKPTQDVYYFMTKLENSVVRKIYKIDYATKTVQHLQTINNEYGAHNSLYIDMKNSSDPKHVLIESNVSYGQVNQFMKGISTNIGGRVVHGYVDTPSNIYFMLNESGSIRYSSLSKIDYTSISKSGNTFSGRERIAYINGIVYTFSYRSVAYKNANDLDVGFTLIDMSSVLPGDTQMKSGFAATNGTVSVCACTSGTQSIILRTTDGKNFTVIPIPGAMQLKDPHSLKYDGTNFKISFGGQYMYSSDGITWTVVTNVAYYNTCIIA